MRLNLKLLRIKHGLTQTEMAARLKVSVRTYGNIETGKRNGELNFWLKLKAEFPEITIEDMAEVRSEQDAKKA